MEGKHYSPVTRNALFYSEQDYDLETSIVEQYFTEDLGQAVVLYEVDRNRTNVDTVYKEAETVRYKPPREIPCMYEVAQPDARSYDSRTANGVYTVSGNLTCYVLLKTLENLKCDIRKGDYLAVQADTGRMYYYSVVNDGKLNNANSYHIGAYKSGWRVITAAPSTKNEFNGR